MSPSSILSIIVAIVLLVILVVISISVSVFQFYVFIVGHWKGAPFVPSSKKEIYAMLELANIKPGEIVVDLGSGNGTILIEAARKGATVIGIEMNPFLIWYSRFRIKHLGLANMITVYKGDLRDFPLECADVVFLYLLPNTIANLREKLTRELRKGSRVVSNSFPIPEWPVEAKKTVVYLYQKT